MNYLKMEEVYHYSNFSFFPSASDTLNHLVFTYMRFYIFLQINDKYFKLSRI